MSIGEQDPERRYYGKPLYEGDGSEFKKSLDDATENEWNGLQSKLPVLTEKDYKELYDESTNTVTLVPNNDVINHPSHYTNRSMEAIDIIEMIIEIEKNPKVAYNMSNVLKYLLRFRDKGKAIEDLNKAKWYLSRMIKHVEDENGKL